MSFKEEESFNTLFKYNFPLGKVQDHEVSSSIKGGKSLRNWQELLASETCAVRALILN